MFLDSRPENYSKYFNLSVSKIKSFEGCKLKYRYSYIEKLPQKQYDFHIFGKFLHQVLESFHIELIKDANKPYHLVMQECFKQALINYSSVNPEQKKEAFKICIAYLNKIAKHLPQVLAVERCFYIDINGKYLLNGYIDRIQLDEDKTVHVSDYKTSKSKTYLAKDYFQLMVYALALCLENPEISKIRTSYIMLKHDCEELIKEFSRDEVLAVGDKIIKSAELMQSEQLYTPSPSPLCEFCDYQNLCPAGQNFMNKYKPQKSAIGLVEW